MSKMGREQKKKNLIKKKNISCEKTFPIDKNHHLKKEQVIIRAVASQLA